MISLKGLDAAWDAKELAARSEPGVVDRYFSFRGGRDTFAKINRLKSTEAHKRKRKQEASFGLTKAKKAQMREGAVKRKRAKRVAKAESGANDFEEHFHKGDSVQATGPRISTDEQLAETALTFRYDNLKARKADKVAAFREWRRLHKGKKTPGNLMVHHINHDHADPRAGNMQACTKSQEKKLHWQIIQIFTEMVNAGIVKFNKVLNQYYIDDPHDVQRINDYRKRRESYISNRALAQRFGTVT